LRIRTQLSLLLPLTIVLPRLATMRQSLYACISLYPNR
jgi:hypothetical protein